MIWARLPELAALPGFLGGFAGLAQVLAICSSFASLPCVGQVTATMGQLQPSSWPAVAPANWPAWAANKRN